jgi:hypothetical protein
MSCLEKVIRYHEATKHRFEGFARGARPDGLGYVA